MDSAENIDVDQEFEYLYGLAESFSMESHINLSEIFNSILRISLSTRSGNILYELQNCYGKPKVLDFIQNSHHLDCESWLIIGETGQGKSTLINSLCDCQVAKEGEGLKSATVTVDSYFTSDGVLLIDTPGFFDTRMIENKDISQQIIKKVQESLRENAHIDAIFFVWCPNFSLRLRFEEILEEITEALGKKVIESMIFLINQVSSNWHEKHEEAVSEFRKELVQHYGLENKVLRVDAKNLKPEDLAKIRHAVKNVKPFKESEFQVYRQEFYYDKYLQFKIEEEQKAIARKERERIAKEIEEKLETQLRAKEEKQRKEMAEAEERRRKEMKETQEKQRREREKLEKEMRERRKEEEERLAKLEKERQEMKRIFEEQEDQRVYEAFEHQLEQLLLEEKMTRELREIQERQQKERERIEREIYFGRQGEQQRERRLQGELNRPNTNRDGVRVWRGTLGNHYCGRKGLYYCSSCDGECGPSDGCNCPACAELDRKKGIEKYPHRTRINQDSVNGDGVRVRQGERGNHYCGRKGLYYCASCDGTCGPTNGCNCPACGELDRRKGISPWHREPDLISTAQSFLRLFNAMGK